VPPYAVLGWPGLRGRLGWVRIQTYHDYFCNLLNIFGFVNTFKNVSFSFKDFRPLCPGGKGGDWSTLHHNLP